MKTMQTGRNRTGVALAPDLAQAMIEIAQATPPSSDGNAQAIAQVRIDYATKAEPVGSMPPAMRGKSGDGGPAVMPAFLDKVGERLAFERAGVRLYDALLSKLDAYGSFDDGPSRGELEEIRSEEFQHFALLSKAMAKLSGDPTAVTPSANLHAVASQGLPAVLADPRTNLRECLEAILVAELVDNDCWENLSDLALVLGEKELAAEFEQALENERDHLRRVRSWVGAGLSQAATGRVERPFLQRAEQREGRADRATNGRPRATAQPRRSKMAKSEPRRTTKTKRAGKTSTRSARRR